MQGDWLLDMFIKENADSLLYTRPFDSDSYRAQTLYSHLDKVKFYECIENSLKYIIEKGCCIKVDDIFECDCDITFMEKFCYLIKRKLSVLQGYEIEWYIEAGRTDVAIGTDDKGIIEAIITGESPDYSSVFKVLMFELKQECFRMEGYNLDEQSLKKIKINKEENKND